MSQGQKPSVGRIVHFYSDAVRPPPGSASPGFNGQGKGPYPAIITQVFPDANGDIMYANMKVFPPFAPPFDEGSVSEGEEKCPGRYWVWPPREDAHRKADVPFALTEDQIKRMAERFLSWRLPEPFRPDAGISFVAPTGPNAHVHYPTGTNLWGYTEAVEMVRHMAEGLGQ